ncbi:hypothetical protein M2408_005417 [Sphingobacterium sp. BIGb0165]|nr:hypothetical protein [Sphingobacterium sp. BIGb0165]
MSINPTCSGLIYTSMVDKTMAAGQLDAMLAAVPVGRLPKK